MIGFQFCLAEIPRMDCRCSSARWLPCDVLLIFITQNSCSHRYLPPLHTIDWARGWSHVASCLGRKLLRCTMGCIVCVSSAVYITSCSAGLHWTSGKKGWCPVVRHTLGPMCCYFIPSLYPKRQNHYLEGQLINPFPTYCRHQIEPFNQSVTELDISEYTFYKNLF